jgi:hypothetical protein
MPQVSDGGLRNYSGYFHCNDDQLNRVWYASAYTCQLCTIPSTQGNSLVDLQATDPNLPTYWWANSTLTHGTTALVDGAKRDKLIWPGDFGISVPTVFLSTNDAESIKLSLEQLFAQQNATTGKLPYAAAPIVVEPPDSVVEAISQTFSFTYHLYNIIGLINYFIYSGDLAFVQRQWNRVKLAVDYSISFVDDTGLAYVVPSATADWLRFGMGARNIEVRAYQYDLSTRRSRLIWNRQIRFYITRSMRPLFSHKR